MKLCNLCIKKLFKTNNQKSATTICRVFYTLVDFEKLYIIAASNLIH
uniref:Uncharacterized protein n=1 Tax=uncultured delta proteobacterium HF0130_19C20 TaxID=710828 RepID=E0XT48_9DELT|nr:hypothetical protein [uncultured delta proteobacterium HF0130_19C20]